MTSFYRVDSTVPDQQREPSCRERWRFPPIPPHTLSLDGLCPFEQTLAPISDTIL